MSDRYVEESGSKLLRKSRENPFFPVAISGLLIACGVMAYRYKTKGDMKTSVYLIQTRVIAQGTVVGTLAIGVLYTMINRAFFKNDTPK